MVYINPEFGRIKVKSLIVGVLEIIVRKLLKMSFENPCELKITHNQFMKLLALTLSDKKFSVSPNDSSQ